MLEIRGILWGGGGGEVAISPLKPGPDVCGANEIPPDGTILEIRTRLSRSIGEDSLLNRNRRVPIDVTKDPAAFNNTHSNKIVTILLFDVRETANDELHNSREYEWWWW